MSSSSGSTRYGTSRSASAISAVSRVRGKRVWTQASSGMFATWIPSWRASSSPCSVRETGTVGSPLIRRSRFSVECAWRTITNSRMGPQATGRRPQSVCLNGRVTPLATQVQELSDNRVRLEVEVPSDDVHHAVEHAASDLAGSLRIPGFRKGKVPMPVLLARVGRERLYSEAVESHIGTWFWNAAARSRIRPVEQPSYDYELPDSEHDAWRFSATVAVQPKVEAPDWTKLEVPYVEPEVPPEAADAELERLRSSVAELVPVEDRPVADGDTVVVDLVSPGGEAQRDYVVELGQGRLLDELEAGIVGMEAGETKQVEAELADGSTASVEVTLKEIKEKVLPPLDDDLARAASEFETLAELRDEIESRLREQPEADTESAFRAA